MSARAHVCFAHPAQLNLQERDSGGRRQGTLLPDVKSAEPGEIVVPPPPPPGSPGGPYASYAVPPLLAGEEASEAPSMVHTDSIPHALILWL